MSRLRRIATSNIAALAVQQASIVIAGLGLQIYLARRLTKADFGTIAFIASVIALVGFLAQMRVSPLIARNIAREPESAATWMARGQHATFLMAPLASVIAVVWVAVQDGRTAVVLAAVLAVIALCANSLMVIADAVLQGLSKLTPIAPAWVLGRTVLVIATVAAVESGGTIIAVYGGQVAGALVVLGALLLAVRKTIGPWSLLVSRQEVKNLLSNGIPFAGVALFSSVYLMADVILLQYISGEEEVAVYRVASLAVVHLPILSLIVVRGLFPRMAKHQGKPLVAGEELNFAVRMLLTISLPLAVGGMLVAEPLLVTAVGERYAVAALPMLWLLPMVPLRFLCNATGMTMMVLDQQSLRAKGLAIAAVSNVLLNLLLIPTYGATAAAATTLLADIFLIIFQGIAVRRVATGVQYIQPIVMLLPALAVLVAVVLLTPNLPVLLRVGLAGLAYGATVIATRRVTREEVGRLIRI